MRYDKLKYERIRNLRVDRNLTQKKMAEELHLKQNTFAQYELGDRNIPNETLVKIAEFLETSTDYLLNVTDVSIPYPRSEKK